MPAQSAGLDPIHLPHLKTLCLYEIGHDAIRGILTSVKASASLRLKSKTLDGATLHDILPQPADVMKNPPNLCATMNLVIFGETESTLPRISGRTFNFEFADHTRGDWDPFVQEVFLSIVRIPFPALKSLILHNLTEEVFDPMILSSDI
ncbi:hypothetical protein BOTBODRAFT_181744 [Botryobasidium botryosum FD-172 SS1]|uniref:Uncharacterized protein n=1 Tax=Botryobasidium botryosum (strain FD-172 SS1) TaxID=930990 RepID=A0A067LVI7_BOTB1|nr:hypothetical protein BOTBODRAFT_181744 [Botryobasidium botryosum FD-172 SS1]